MEPIVIKVNKILLDKMKKFYDSQMISNEDSHVLFAAKTVGCEIACHDDLTVNFVGINALNEANRWQKSSKKTHQLYDDGICIQNHIGAAEYGSADYFGPMCIVACYVDQDDINWLKEIDVTNTMHLSNQEIIEKARQIKDRILYSLLLLDNAHYNKAIGNGVNQANLKAKLHNQAITNIMQKLQQSVDTKVIEQFVSSKTYYNYLKSEVVVVKDVQFEQNADLKFYAVGCSYILAKYAYLQYFANMCKSLKVTLPRGTSTNVDVIGSDLVCTYGENILNKTAKLHLTNTRRIRDLAAKKGI